jgi:hypothetical protein
MDWQDGERTHQAESKGYLRESKKRANKDLFYFGLITPSLLSEESARDISNLLVGRSEAPNETASIEETRASQKCASCHAHLPLPEHAPRDLGRHIFMINTRDFMDPYTFNVKNAMKCCVEVLVPDGRMIPFCTYNTMGYREKVRDTLLTQASKLPAQGQT